MSRALIIGTGRMARIRLAVLRARDDIDEVVVATKDVERASELAADGVRVVAIDELPATPPRMTFVASATASHRDDVQRALALGAPVLCEKPLADDAAVAGQLAAAAADTGAALHVAFQRHFEPPLRQLRARIAGGEIGVPYHLRFTHFDHYPSTREFIATSAGIYKDLLVHDIECAMWLTGMPVASVFATGSVRKWQDYADFGDSDTATVLLEMRDGLCVSLQGTRHHPFGQDARVEVVGSESAAAAGLTPATPLVTIDRPDLLNNDPFQTFQARFADAFVAETNAFADHALGIASTFDGTTARTAAEAVAVAEACERSHARRQPVAVEAGS